MKFEELQDQSESSSTLVFPHGRYNNLQSKVMDKRDKQLKCPQCSHKASQTCNLKRHIKTHENIRNHICSICEFATTVKEKLMEHKEFLHNIKFLNCEKCPYATDCKKALQSHIKAVREDKRPSM